MIELKTIVMIRIIALFALAFFLLTKLSFGQKNTVPDGQTAKRLGIDYRNEPEIDLRDLRSTISCLSCLYGPGRTLDAVFSYDHISPDDEWTDGLYLVFPQGVTVNNAKA